MSDLSGEMVMFQSLTRVLGACEATGQFPFGSRRFYGVGEWSLAFFGIYRFVEGNIDFKNEVIDDYLLLLDHFRRDVEKSRGRLTVFHWRPCEV